MEKLPLIRVYALDLHVKYRVRIDLYMVLVGDILRKPALALVFDLPQPRKKLRIVFKFKQCLKLFRIGDPSVAYIFRKQRCKLGIRFNEKTPVAYAVRLIVKFVRHKAVKFLERIRLQYLCMKRGDAVYGMAADDR